MLGRMVQGHLCDRPLHEVADGLQLAAKYPHLENRVQDRVGSQIGPYRLLELLGRGGMGAVLKAERRHQAYVHQGTLKLMAETGPQQRERFLREQKILSALRHPNIARLSDAGESDQGEPYLVLEYVAGESMLDAAKRQRAPLHLRLQWLITASEALAHAHRHLVIHRDLKPSNVMLDDNGHVRLLDFGIAKLIAGDVGPDLTQAEFGPMTPEYAAPEQFRGEPVTVATDLYQLGVLAYVLLTERMPYGESSRGRMAWAQAVCDTDPEPLKTLEIKRLSVSGGSRRARKVRGELNAALPANRVWRQNVWCWCGPWQPPAWGARNPTWRCCATMSLACSKTTTSLPGTGSKQRCTWRRSCKIRVRTTKPRSGTSAGGPSSPRRNSWRTPGQAPS